MDTLRFHRSDGFRPFDTVVSALGDGAALSTLVDRCEAQRAQGDAMDALLQRRLRAEFLRLGLFDAPDDPSRLDPALRAWFEAACRLLERGGLLRTTATGFAPVEPLSDDLDTLRAQWRKGAVAWPLVGAHWRLADAVLAALPDILAGRRPATAVLFPDGGLGLVQDVYGGNPVSDYFNGLVAEAVAIAADAAHAAGRTLRILEIGAGTGGTSRVVFDRLREQTGAIAEYRYTDVSRAFLLHARETYAPTRPWLRTALFDVERDAAAQDLEAGAYDLVLATNVLHATRHIRRTLRHAKALLRNGGLLVLNEMSTNGGTFTHLTFGLTPGWWLFEDPALRLPGGPGLAPTGWATALRDEGFPRIAFPASDRHDYGLQLVIAESNGMVRGAAAPSPQVAPAASAQAPVAAPAMTASPVAPSAPAPRSQAARLEFVRRAVLEELRHCLMLDALPEGDEAFADLGLDSIVGVMFVRRINERLGTTLDHNATFDHSNATKLARHLLAEHAVRFEAEPPASQPPVAASTPQPLAVASPPASVPVERAPPAVASAAPRAGSDADGGIVPIAVVGMSGVFAQSEDLDALWSHLAAGRDLVVPFPRRGDDTPAPGIVGGFLERVDEFDALFFAISGQEATWMDPQQRLFLQECWRALEDAGYAGCALDGARCGVYVGGAAGDYPALFGDDYAPQALWGNLGSLIASRISYFLNLRGPALVIDTACSSSLVSLHLACRALSAGEIDAALAGGVFMLSTSGYFAALQRAGMFSASGRCHTFDAAADGFVPAEGAGAVLLRRLDDALADGDHIHGVIRGSGMNQDGASNGITAPSAASQEQLETGVYAACDLNPRRLQMIEAHGTGTILGDPIEHSALCRAFRRHTDAVGFCALGSIKTNLGHAQSAAGIAGVLKVLLALRHRLIPPSLHFERCNPAIDFPSGPFYVNTALREWPRNRDEHGAVVPRCAAVSSFGISGTNAHLVIEEAPERVRTATTRPAHLVALSARTEAELKRQVERLLARCEADDTLDCGDLAFTLLTGRRHFAERLACVVEDRADLVRTLRRWQAGETDGLHRSVRGARGGDTLAEPAERALDACLAAVDASTLRAALSTLADLHVRGATIDFAPLFAGSGARRVPLPTYPLLRDRYWVPASKRPSPAASAGTRLINTSTFDGIRFTVRHDAARGGAETLPLLLREALAEVEPAARETRRLRELRWGAPLPAACDLHAVLYPDGADGCLLEAHALTADGTRTVFLQARAERGAKFDTRAEDIDATHWRPLPDRDASAAVLAAMIEAAGGGTPAALESLEGHGDWRDARAIRITTRAGRVDAIVRDADGTIIGRAIGLSTDSSIDASIAAPSRNDWLLLGGEWQATPWTEAPAPVAGEARLLLRLGADEDAASATALAALAAEGVAVLRFEVCDGPGFVRGCTQLLAWCREALATRGDAPLRIQALVDDTPAFEACAAGLAGFLRSAMAEQPAWRGQVIRIEPAVAGDAAALRRLLDREAGESAIEIRHRDSRRDVRVLAPLPSPGTDSATTAPAFREGGTYLIAGGAGGLGLLLAETLAARLQRARLILTGRSALDAARTQRLAALCRDGFTVDYRAVAVEDDEGMRALLRELAADGVTGIVHAAGALRDGWLARKTDAELAEAMTAKVVGAEVLDALIEDLGLAPEWFVLFSSITGEYGNAGQADYAAANAYLRGFAERRQTQVGAGARRGRTLAIDWPLWRDGGMSVDAATDAFLRRRGLVPLETAQGMALLANATGIAAAHAVALFGDTALLRRHFLGEDSVATAMDASPAVDGVPDEELRSRVEGKLVDLFAAIALLPADRIDPGEALVQYGIDSLMVVQLNEALETAFGALPKTLMFEHRTLAALAAHLCTRHRESALRWCGLAARAAVASPPAVVDTPVVRATLVPFAAPGFATTYGAAATVREPIAIIGLSGRYPGAPDLAAFWENLRNGVDAVGEIPPTRWDVEAWQAPDVETAVAQGLHYTRAGAFLEDFDAFDPLFFRMSPADAYDLNPQERLFLESCWTTLEDGGYAPARLARQHGGRVGVFAGITKTGYELHGPALWAQGKRGYPHTSFASVANRVSYLLDLNGPSLPVDTMCSASLTAIHEACEHLLRDECELALAGGVNLYLHPANYLLLCGQRMLSPTGRCHSFGADGDGFVPGEGVGTVLLKRLSAAQRDGDPIRALIRATAVNHDGRTNGYTVPNPAAQAALVRAALDRAGLDARAVGCIEAHGTGTRLGDPIEIAGLAQAFAVDTADTGFCAIGSLKSNIGHLEAAAGIAGLTKLVLQLQHGELVPSLHADALNPDIDFARTPFRVQRTLAPWTRPRRADGREGTRIGGLSSFGAGGANAHALLEEYVETRPAPAAVAGPQLILLSARDDARLAEAVDRLLRAIETRDDADLPAIAYTLQVGREAMEARLALTVRDISHLRDALRRHRDGERVDGLHRGTVPRNRDAIALFESDEDLRAAVAAWLRKGKHDRLLGLWVKGLNVDWDTVWGDAHPRCLSLPGYPFAREHYWIAPGASASTTAAASVAALHPLLHENRSGFAAQRFRSRFSGREGVFADHRVQGRRILPGVASLEMAREAVARSLDDPSAIIALRDVVWLRPIVAEAPVAVEVRLDVVDDTTIAFAIVVVDDDADAAICCRGVATIETTPATEALDLDRLRTRCARSGASPEDFYAALAEAGMVYGPHQRSVEALWLGDGEALAQLRLPAAANIAGYVLHPSLLDGALQATAALAEAGSGLRVATVPFALDAAVIHASCAPNLWAWIRASSETGEAVHRLDIDLCDDDGALRIALRGLAARRIDRGDEAPPTTRLLVPRWSTAALPQGELPPNHRLREVLFCGWPADRVAAVAALMPDARCHAVAGEGDDIGALFDDAVVATIDALRRLADVDAAPASALLQIAIPDDRPLLEGVSGLLLTAGHELPSVAAQCVRLPADSGAAALSLRLSEAAGIPDARMVRFDAERMSVRDFVPVEATPADPSPVVWRQRGVYWIAGGAGGLGLRVAEDIVACVADATILLTGRRPAEALAPDALDALRAGGAVVEYHALDLTDAEAVSAWTRAQVARFGRLDGVFHAAGELRDGYLVHKPVDDIRAVLAAKVAGTLAIDAATRDLTLDLFVLFASLAGAYGNAGQGDYAAGNAFLDAFAAVRNREVAAGRRSGRTVSIDWPLWADGGMRTAPAVERMMRERHGLEPLDAVSGLRALHRALAIAGADQVVVLHGRERAAAASVPAAAPPPAPRRPAPASSPAPAMASASIGTTRDADTLRDRAERHLAGLLADALKMDPSRVDPRAPLEHYGIDSIKVMDLTFALERHFGTLSKTLFFEYQTIADLTGYFVRRHPERLAELLGAAPASTAMPALAAPTANPSSHDVPVRLARKRMPGAHGDDIAAAAPIAIVGVSGRYPMAADLETFWEHLRDGRDCVTAIPAERWDHARYFDDAAHPQGGTFCRWGGFLDGVAEFDPLFFRITPLEATYVDPQERLFLQCAFSALEDAGHTRESLRAATGGRVGVYVGVMYEEYPMFGVEAQREGRRIALTGSPASIANRVSYFCNLSGPSMAVDSMCSSSLTTLHLACQSLRLGECEAAIAGGVNVSLHPNKYILLEQGHFASSNGRCESFGRGGDGYVPGEGVGAVLLRPLARAVADGDHIHGVILGSALNHGGKTNGYTVPNPNAQGAVIAEALAAAGVAPSRIGYIEAHGTGTALGDPIEIAGLLQAFEREALPRGACPIGSVKSNIGHCESAAGIAGLSKVLLQMRHGRIAPSLHSDVLNPAIDFAGSPFFVPQTLLPWPRPVEDTVAGPRERPRIAGISSFGAGGANAHVIVAEHLPSRAVEPAGGPQAIVLSARTRAALDARARDLLAAIERGRLVADDFDAIACTLQRGREAMAWRAGFVAADLDALAAGLRALLAGSTRIRLGEVRVDAAPVTVEAQGREGQDLDARVAAWVAGADVPWRTLRGARAIRRVPLPTYPFERTVYWADVTRIPVLPGFASPSPAADAAPALPAQDRALVRIWRPSPLPASTPFAAGQLFVLATPALADVCAALALRAPGLRVRSLMHGGDADFLSADACEPLLERFDVAADAPVALLDLTALDADYEADAAPECGKWRLLQGFVERHARTGALVVQATCGLADARGGVPTLHGARTIGLYRALGAEYGRLRVCSVDLDPAETAAETRAARLLAELGALATGASVEGEICLHGDRRLVARFEARPLPAAASPRDDVVLITGGTGGIGGALAAHLVAAGTRAVAVLGREPLPPPADWPSALRDDPDPARRARLRRLQALVDAGARVRYASVPLSDVAALADEIAAIEAALGPIATVYHCAGSGGATPAFVKKPIDEIRAVVLPKTLGLHALLAAFPAERAPGFVLCASVSGAVPALGAGQVDYAMANAYLDQVVARRRAQGHVGDRAVQWPLWREVGMAADAAPSQAYRRSGLPWLDTADGLRLFDAALACDAGVLMPIGRAAVNADALLHPASATTPTPPAITAVATAMAPAAGSRRQAIVAWLRTVFVAEFGLPEAELIETRPFVDYGVDSIFVVQAVARMQRESGRPVDPALLFEHDTLGRLADHLDADATFDIAFTGSATGTPAVESAPPVMPSSAANAATNASVRIDATATDPQAPVEIAVIGLACRLPGAPDREAYWRLLADGASAIGPVPAGRWQVTDRARYLGGWVDDVDLFDPEFFGLHPDDARVMDPQARLVLEEALAAFCDAGYRREDVSGARAGVYVGGRARVDAAALEAVFAAPNPILGIGQNYLATNVSRLFNLTGPSLVVDTACSSGVTGIALAAEALRAGQIDLALAGAVSLLQDPVAHDLFAARNILSPDGQFRLFDRRAGGEVLGEGVGLVVLKRLADAQRDGDHVRAVIRAIALNNDGRTLGPGSPNLAAQRQVLRQALEQAGATAADVGYIEVNGGGSPVPDSIEIKALSEVYALQDRSLGACHVGSIKPNVGHLLLTSGIASFIRCVLSLEQRRIPPFLSARDPFAFYDFAASRIVFDRATVEWDVPTGGRRLAAMSSFADGGTNCHVLIEEAPPATASRASLPLPPMRRRPMVPAARPSPAVETQSTTPIREDAPVAAMENFWGRYVDTTV